MQRQFWAESAATLKTVLAAAALQDFEGLWQCQAELVDEPNTGRGGHSMVSRLALANGQAIYIKRQENHLCRTWLHPVRGVPTFYREWLNIQRLQQQGIGCVQAVYYGERRLARSWQAILVTAALDDFVCLDDWNRLHPEPGEQRLSLLQATAEVIAHMHRCRFQHGCLYGKHIFVRRSPANGSLYGVDDIRLIDLEKLRKGLRRDRISQHDLDQLVRHTTGWGEQDVEQFMAFYRGQLTRPL